MKTQSTNQTINNFIKIVLLSILIFASYAIAKPFIILIIWAIIVAVALYPFYQKITGKFTGKKKSMVSTFFIIALLALIIVPATHMTQSIVGSTKVILHQFEEGALKIAPPNEKVKDWPLVGKKIYSVWSNANSDIEGFIRSNPETVKNSVGWFFDSFKGMMGSVLLSLVAIIIAGIFMSNADGGYKVGLDFANKIMDGKGFDFMKMSINTIRSVVKGIILVAFIQAVLAFIGFATIGMSTAGLLAFVVMFAAIIQIPVTLVVIPVIIYVFSIEETTTAVIFAIYMMVVSLLDNFLKPMLLAKGLQTPMIIILIGAIGGMISGGILGLFIGPVVLAIAHNLYTSWVNSAAEVN